MSDVQPFPAFSDVPDLPEQIGALHLSQNHGLALVSVALRHDSARPLPMGLRLPDPGGWCSGHGMAAFWTGPDHWLIEAELDESRPSGAVFAAELRAHGGPGYAICDQTAQWIVLEIDSAEGSRPLAGLLRTLGLADPDGFGAGQAARLDLSGAECFVIRRGPARLAVLGRRAVDGAIYHTLAQAARRQVLETQI